MNDKTLLNLKPYNSGKPRLRLAPSPTGFLHLGNFRTALFGYLLAKKWGGEFILRLEDTDRERLVEGSLESLLAVMSRCGLSFDESPKLGGPVAPYVQSERLELYKQVADYLLSQGKAYRCFCTSEELEAMRQEQAANKLPPRYDRRYRETPEEEIKTKLEAGEPYVIRHKMPLEGEVVVKDDLRGETTFKASELDDYVLLKSDGWPTYHLASVVDDYLMGITHVTRGVEWLPSLPKNVSLYRDLGWPEPIFIHLPLILNKEGGKLSKRQGDVFVEDFLNKGYLPEALINYTALLGWHPKEKREEGKGKGDDEIFSLKELEELFDLNGLGVSPAVFDLEKLDYYNGYYLRQIDLNDLLKRAEPFMEKLLDEDSANGTKIAEYKRGEEFIKKALELERSRLVRLDEIPEILTYLFLDEVHYEAELLNWKNIEKAELKNNLALVKNLLSSIDKQTWDLDNLNKAVIEKLKEDSLPLGPYLWPLRVSLSGKKASPGPLEIAFVLGKDETLDRLEKALARLS